MILRKAIKLRSYYEGSFLIVFHNVRNTGPGKAADQIF